MEEILLNPFETNVIKTKMLQEHKTTTWARIVRLFWVILISHIIELFQNPTVVLPTKFSHNEPTKIAG